MSPKTLFRRVVITTTDVYASNFTDHIEEEALLECRCGYSAEDEGEYVSMLSEEVGSMVQKQGQCLILEVLPHQMRWDVLVDLNGWPRCESESLSQVLTASGLSVGFGEIGKAPRVDLTYLVRDDVHLARLAVNFNLLSQLGEDRRPYLIRAMKKFAGTDLSTKPTF